MPEVIKLVAPIKLKRKKGIAEWRERKTLFGKAVKTMTSLKTTAVLGATLGTLLAPQTALGLVKGAGRMIMPKTIKGVVGMGVGVPVAMGVLSSARARKSVKKYLDPRESYKRGEYIAGIIEDPDKIKKIGKEEGWWGTIKEGAKKGGKFGAIATGIIAGGFAVKKGKEIWEEKKRLKDVGIVKRSLPVVPSTLAHPYVPQTAMPSPQISPIGAPQPTQMPKPITNIIQIQLR